ncbi:MAG TPA: hypothetical protein VJX67_07585, partial [Blastocatellia bacterium]|nr:hypothetical protein [Blastocatellia bacterium]
DSSEKLCRACGRSLNSGATGSLPAKKRKGSDQEEPGEIYKFLALGVFIGCVIAGGLVLFMMMGSSGKSNGSEQSQPVKPLSVTSSPAATDSSPSGTDSADPGSASGNHADTVMNGLRERRPRRKDAGNQSKGSPYGKAVVITKPGKTPTMLEPQ